MRDRSQQRRHQLDRVTLPDGTVIPVHHQRHEYGDRSQTLVIASSGHSALLDATLESSQNLNSTVHKGEKNG
jgi:hypothetical protein